MLISLSWRNVWRNKTRSMIVVVAMSLGVFGGVMAMGIINGWVEQRIHDSIYNEISHVQIHNPKYLLNEETQYYISDYSKVVSTLDTMKSVVGYSGRIKIFGMAQSDRASTGIEILGINPAEEKRVSEVSSKIIDGEFLGKNHPVPSIVVGGKTAENLRLINYSVTAEKLDSIKKAIPHEVYLGLQKIQDQKFRTKTSFQKAIVQNVSEKDYNKYVESLVKQFSFYRLNSPIILTIQTPSGELHNQMFRVRGVYHTTNTSFDARYAYVDRNILAATAELDSNQVHEVAIICKGMQEATEVSSKLSSNFPALSVMSWKEVSPEIALYASFGNFMGMIYVIIILFALAFGIINTMMMSVLERIRELGMLMAVGMNRIRLFGMIMLESIFLSLTGGMVGLVLSGVVLKVLAHTGIDFGMWAEGFEAIGYAAVVYPEVSWGNFFGVTTLVILTGMIASLWPARRALRLNPVEALRQE